MKYLCKFVQHLEEGRAFVVTLQSAVVSMLASLTGV